MKPLHHPADNQHIAGIFTILGRVYKCELLGQTTRFTFHLNTNKKITPLILTEWKRKRDPVTDKHKITPVIFTGWKRKRDPVTDQ